MPPPDLTTPAALPTDSGRPADRRLRVASKDAVRAQSILGRRDAATTPWLLVGIVAFSIALSEGLHAPGGQAMWWTIGVTVSYAMIGLGMALYRGRATASPKPVNELSYVAFCAVLIVLICGGSALSDGVQTIYFSSLVLIAAYLGLVISLRWVAALTALMLVGGGVAHAISPAATALDVLSSLSLIVASALLGMFCGAAHRRAERVAMRLSRCDDLTTMLNRRGFMEQLEIEARDARAARAPIALLIFDLDGFKGVNTGGGTESGDRLLAWIGESLRELLPDEAAAGRLGGDEFGVALPGSTREQAEVVAERLRSRISERNPVSIGVATSQDSAVTADDLLKVAEAAMVVAKQDPAIDVQVLVAGAVMRTSGPARVRTVPLARPVITYATLRKMGGRPVQPEANVLFGWLIRDSFAVLGAAGLVVVVMTILGDGTSFYDDVIRYLGIPWVLANVAIAIYFSGRPVVAEGRVLAFVATASLLLVVLGVGTAALAAGGFIAPIFAGYYLKVLFDSAVAAKNLNRGIFSVMLAWWVLVVILSPAGEFWALPFSLCMMLSAYLLGSINNRAVEDSTAQWITLARTDVLTGLKNRTGFALTADPLLDGARSAGGRVALVLVNLDHFKRFNDQHGLAAGDALLQRVAEIMRQTLPETALLGRIGGDEFVAAIQTRSLDDADRFAEQIGQALAPVISASTASAVFPDDGDDLEHVVHTADMRAREVKFQRSLQSMPDA